MCLEKTLEFHKNSNTTKLRPGYFSFGDATAGQVVGLKHNTLRIVSLSALECPCHYLMYMAYTNEKIKL